MVLAVAIGVGVVALATDDSCDGATQPDCVIIESGLDPVLYGLAFSIPGEVGAFVGLLVGAAVRRRDGAAVG